MFSLFRLSGTSIAVPAGGVSRDVGTPPMIQHCCRPLICLFATVNLLPPLASAQSNYATPYLVSTIAGTNSAGTADGSPAQARFSSPGAVAVVRPDVVYVADSNNHTIRKITVGQGVTTLAGEPGVSGFRNGNGKEARFSTPNGVAVDLSGNVYVADTANHLIRKITPDGTVTTFAGLPGASGLVDGSLTAARFFSPWGIAVDLLNNIVYVADSANHVIRKISANEVSTLAGGTGPTVFGSNDGVGRAARFGSPRGVAVNFFKGDVYVADRDNNLIRKITSTGMVSTLAGIADRTSGSVDGTGSGARFNSPYSVTVDPFFETVYVVDAANCTIRKVTPSGVVTTLAGLTNVVGTVDGVGSAARFSSPHGIAIADDGSLFIADSNNHMIRRGQLAPALSPVAVIFWAGLGPWASLPSGAALSLGPRDSVEFRCTVTGNISSSYWLKDGIKIEPGDGAAVTGTVRLLAIPSLNPSHTGNYTMVGTTPLGLITTNVVTLNVSPPPSARLANLSILTNVASSGDSFTMGYVVGGAGTSGPKPILIRAAGPTLGAAPFLIGGILADPRLELFAGATKTVENDNWGGTAALSTAFSSVGAFAYISGTSLDAAVFTNVSSGDNSVRVSATGTGTGTVIAELYDSTPIANVTVATPRLVNVSVLKHLGTGLTAGFVIDGNAPKKVLIRAIGPTIGAEPFRVGDVVVDPQLALYVGATSIASNDNWGGTAELSAAFGQTGAFPLPSASRDAALLATLQPGNYTVQVSGVNGTTGVALVEIYEVP
jgi:hypothetical protein